MDAADVAQRQALKARNEELRSRAAQARGRAAAERRRAEEACARAAAVLVAHDGRPFGDRGSSFVLGIARVPSLVRLVRHDLRRWLERAGVRSELVSEITLACSEACANAVEHPHRASRQLVEVEAVLDDAELELRIRDFGAWSERPGSAVRGRGLDMIRTIMDSLDVRRTAQGTELVMRRSLTS
jgi:anti-sigma regulatory factor (Ser/Thr protein kinase)